MIYIDLLCKKKEFLNSFYFDLLLKKMNFFFLFKLGFLKNKLKYLKIKKNISRIKTIFNKKNENFKR